MHCVHELYCIFAISIFLFSFVLQMSRLILKVSQTKRQTWGSTWGVKNEARMEKLLGVIPLHQDLQMNLMPILFCYISQVIGQ